MDNNISPKGQRKLKEWEKQEQLSNALEESIKEFISKNSGGRYNSLNGLIYEMITGRKMHWEDELRVIKRHIQGIITVFMEPSSIKYFKEICPEDDEHVGETLVRLLEFFYQLENPLSYAEIDLASLESNLKDVNYLTSIELPYKPSF